MLEGEVDVVADGDRYTLRRGRRVLDGRRVRPCLLETQRRPVTWLETRHRGPPDRALLPLRARLGVPRRAARRAPRRY